jgi:ABC-2 type transport system ATP-binding protein
VPAAVVTRDIHKHYGRTRAVDGVSIEIETGEFYGFLGPNGAGKTTTLEIIEGLRKPDSGEVSLLGLPPWPRNEALLPRIGVQFQTSSFFERLTAREQIRTFAALYRVRGRTADDLLEAFGLADVAGTRTERLSGGQAQRLSIACALVHSPEVVVLDEPTAGLDPQARHNLWDLLREINAQGRTVILSTHYLDEAELLCDRVSIMDGGKILRTGPAATLIAEYNAPTRVSVEVRAISLDEAGKLFPDATLDEQAGVLTITTHDPSAVVSELGRRHALAGLAVRGASLEDVFLAVTGREYRS